MPKGLELLVNEEQNGAQEFMRARSIVVKGAGNAKTAFEYIVKYASGELDNKYILDHNAPCFSGSHGIVTISSSKYLYSNPVVAIKLFNLHSAKIDGKGLEHLHGVVRFLLLFYLKTISSCFPVGTCPNPDSITCRYLNTDGPRNRSVLHWGTCSKHARRSTNG